MRTYNHGQKIMKHLEILVQVPFATSKAVLKTQYKKHCIRVISRVAEQIKTLGPQEIRKDWEYHKNGRRQSLVPSLPSTNKKLVLVVMNYAKTDFKVFFFCPILLDFFTLFHKFCRRLQTEKIELAALGERKLNKVIRQESLTDAKVMNLSHESYYMKPITRNLTDTFINTNKADTKLIIANPLKNRFANH